jgi:hypothetical protein
MTLVRGEGDGDHGHHAGGVWRSGRCPSSPETRAGALARFGRIDCLIDPTHHQNVALKRPGVIATGSAQRTVRRSLPQVLIR